MMKPGTIEGICEKPRLASKALGAILAYLEVTKPRSVALLLFTGLTTLMVAGQGYVSGGLFLMVAVAITAGCAGANAVTCYVDRDIDSLMTRTERRPLPQGRIRPPERALYFGLGLMLVALVLAGNINFITFLLMALGLLDNVVIYSLLTKRHSRWNVLWGGISGGLPAALGWSAATGTLNLTAVLIAALVVLWIPNHIWNLAIFYADDYRRARVPMLPVVYELRKAVHCLTSTVLLLYAVSLALYFVAGFSYIYLGMAALLGLGLSLGNLYFTLRPSKEGAWLMFKLSSPYLLLIFAGMLLDVLLA